MTKKKDPKDLQYSRNFPKECAYCSAPFLGYRANSKYCSDTCRYAWQARNFTEKQFKRKQAYQKKWGQENWLKRRAYMLNYTYGISLEQYEELLKRQDYRCFICQKHETEFAKKLAVDHDHRTDEVIGLLCGQCNKDLIGKRRDPELFRRAAQYLEECKTGWYVPKREKKKKPRWKRSKRAR